MSNVKNVKCQERQISRMSNVNNVQCQQCQMSTMSDVNNVKCQLCQMSIKLSKCQSNCQNVNQIVNMSIKLSTCQSNCQHVNQITTRLYYDQSIWIRLAHRLYSDFQYFFYWICKDLASPFPARSTCAWSSLPQNAQIWQNLWLTAQIPEFFYKKSVVFQRLASRVCECERGGSGRVRWEGSGKVHHGERPHFF